MTVLYSLILDRLACYKNHQKLGHLFYNRPTDDKMQVIGGFTCRAGYMNDIGHYVTVDALYRAVHRRNILESMMAYIESLMSETVSVSGPGSIDVQSEWRRRCENAIVIAYNNGKVYRVKRVRFDLTPSSVFEMKSKKTEMLTTSYSDFYRRFYNRIIYDQNQPLLEVYSEKKSETVVLVPELCALTGLTEEMRKDRMLMQEVLQYSRVGTGDKLNQCVAICRDLYSGTTARALMKEWK